MRVMATDFSKAARKADVTSVTTPKLGATRITGVHRGSLTACSNVACP
jgi:hypothetical protein